MNDIVEAKFYTFETYISSLRDGICFEKDEADD